MWLTNGSSQAWSFVAVAHSVVMPGLGPIGVRLWRFGFGEGLEGAATWGFTELSPSVSQYVGDLGEREWRPDGGGQGGGGGGGGGPDGGLGGGLGVRGGGGLPGGQKGVW